MCCQRSIKDVVVRTSIHPPTPPHPTPPHPTPPHINDKNDPKHTGHRSRRHQLTSQRLGQVCRVLKILLAWIILFSSWKLVHFGDIHHFEANPEGLCSKAHSPVMKWDAHENWDFLATKDLWSCRGCDVQGEEGDRPDVGDDYSFI